MLGSNEQPLLYEGISTYPLPFADVQKLL